MENCVVVVTDKYAEYLKILSKKGILIDDTELKINKNLSSLVSKKANELLLTEFKNSKLNSFKYISNSSFCFFCILLEIIINILGCSLHMFILFDDFYTIL